MDDQLRPHRGHYSGEFADRGSTLPERHFANNFEQQQRNHLVSTLLESLKVPDEMFTLRSFGISEWRPGHRYYAVDFLVHTRCRHADVARGRANLLNDADDGLRCFVLRCLARMDNRDDDVLQAIRRSMTDSVPSVASQAELTLRELTE